MGREWMDGEQTGCCNVRCRVLSVERRLRGPVASVGCVCPGRSGPLTYVDSSLICINLG